MKTTLSLALLLSLILVMSSSLSPARAASQNSSLLMPPTSSKTIFLLFYKMAGITFDSNAVLSETTAYKNAKVAEQAQIIADQRLPLENEFASIDPQRQVIVVRTSVKASAMLTPRPAFKISFADDRPASTVYFPYSWAGLDVAVIPDRLDPFLDIPLKASEATAAISKIRDNTATMVIEMQPLKTDRTVMMLDGVQQRLLSSRIVAVSYYNQGMEQIWQWQAPDYRRPGSQSPLLDLKK